MVRDECMGYNKIRLDSLTSYRHPPEIGIVILTHLDITDIELSFLCV